MLQPSRITGVTWERQQEILNAVRANPLDSYVFSGPPGVGKTTYLREVERIVRETCWKNHAIYSNTAQQYQADATALSRGETVGRFIRPSTVIEMGNLHFGCSIFLDDIDKISGSDFVNKTFFGLFNAICEESRTPKTQLVMTTNLRLSELSKFFDASIYWRLTKHCHWVPVERSAIGNAA